jgi:hypothetical protein
MPKDKKILLQSKFRFYYSIYTYRLLDTLDEESFKILTLNYIFRSNKYARLVLFCVKINVQLMYHSILLLFICYIAVFASSSLSKST